MNEIDADEFKEVLAVPERFVKKPVKKRKKAKAAKPRAAKVEADRPVYEGAGEFAGVSASLCPRACTAERCVISTVGQCKHPFKTADNGCGPITMANRAKVRKLIKHQMIDMME